jgi:Transposase and inactivated derivatives
MNYHLVLVVKYRRKVISNKIEDKLIEIFNYIAPNYNIALSKANGESDHIHILFKAHPNSEISKFINAYKSASSRLIKRDFPEIREKLWKETFWSQSFLLATIGEVTLDVVENYINSQGEKLEN